MAMQDRNGYLALPKEENEILGCLATLRFRVWNIETAWNWFWETAFKLETVSHAMSRQSGFPAGTVPKK